MDTSAQNRKMEKVAIRSVQQVTVNSVIAQSDSVPWLIRYGGGNAAEENNGRVSDRYRQ
jgi:hypothetical protein